MLVVLTCGMEEAAVVAEIAKVRMSGGRAIQTIITTTTLMRRRLQLLVLVLTIAATRPENHLATAVSAEDAVPRPTGHRNERPQARQLMMSGTRAKPVLSTARHLAKAQIRAGTVAATRTQHHDPSLAMNARCHSAIPRVMNLLLARS